MKAAKHIITSWVWPALCITLAVVIAMRMGHLIFTLGVDNLSNDYGSWAAPVYRMLAGTYDWGVFFRQTARGGHASIVPLLMHLLVARFANWNVFVELGLGWGLSLVSIALFHAAFTQHQPRDWRWWALWPILSALTLSFTHIPVFTYGEAIFTAVCNQLGLAIAAWGLSRYSPSWSGVVWAALGSTLANWSVGSGAFLWPLLFCSMWLLGYRRKRFFVALVVLGTLSVYPQLHYSFIEPSPRALVKINFNTDWSFILNGLGRAWANNIGSEFGHLDMAYAMGWVGVAGAAMWFLERINHRQGQDWKDSWPAGLSLIYGALITLLASMTRSNWAPWYSSYTVIFWFGLVGLAYQPPAIKWGWAWRGTLATVMTMAFVLTNQTYTDKVFHIHSRAPVSAECLRHYQTAPTYCEGYVYQWGVGRPETLSVIAAYLQPAQLSVFAPDQTWYLQGAYAFDEFVQLSRQANAEPAQWVNVNQQPSPFSDYHLLDWRQPAGNSLQWKMHVPTPVLAANLHTAVRAVNGQGVVSVQLQPGPVFTYTLSTVWQPIVMPLAASAGQTQTIIFHTLNGVALWQNPRVHVSVPYAPSWGVPVTTTTPANVYLGASPKNPAWQSNPSAWQNTSSHLEPATPPFHWHLTSLPGELVHAELLNLELENYTHLGITLKLASDTQRRYIDIVLTYQTPAHPSTTRLITLPLYKTTEQQTVTYPLRLADLPSDARLVGLSVYSHIYPTPVDIHWYGMSFFTSQP